MHKLLFLLLFLNSCTWFYHPATLDIEVPDGPPAYQAGWHDGCQSGLSTRRFANSFVYDVTMGNGIYQSDQVYHDGWNAGWFSCYIHSNTFLQVHPEGTYPLH